MMNNIATKRFAPLIGVLALLVVVALAGSTLSKARKPPAIGPASASIELPEAAPNPTLTTSNAPSALANNQAPSTNAPVEPQQPQQQQPAQQIPPAQQLPAAPVVPVPEVIVPQQPLVYDDFGDDLGDFNFDD